VARRRAVSVSGPIFSLQHSKRAASTFRREHHGAIADETNKNRFLAEDADQEPFKQHDEPVSPSPARKKLTGVLAPVDANGRPTSNGELKAQVDRSTLTHVAQEARSFQRRQPWKKSTLEVERRRRIAVAVGDEFRAQATERLNDEAPRIPCLHRLHYADSVTLVPASSSSTSDPLSSLSYVHCSAQSLDDRIKLLVHYRRLRGLDLKSATDSIPSTSQGVEQAITECLTYPAVIADVVAPWLSTQSSGSQEGAEEDEYLQLTLVGPNSLRQEAASQFRTTTQAEIAPTAATSSTPVSFSFVLWKENIDISSLLRRLAMRFHVRPEAFRTFESTHSKLECGAVEVFVEGVPKELLLSVSDMCFPGYVAKVCNVEPCTFAEWTARAKAYKRAANPKLQMTVLRLVGASSVDLDDRLELLKSQGYINYYNAHVQKATCMMHVIRGAMKRAVFQALFKPEMPEPLLDFLSEPTLEKAAVARESSPSLEMRSVLKAYIQSQGNVFTMFRTIVSRKGWWSALQRYLWNALVSDRIRRYGRKPVVGDFVILRAASEALGGAGELNPISQPSKEGTFNKDQVHQLQTEEECSLYTIFDVVIPVPHYEMSIETDYPRHVPEQHLEATRKVSAVRRAKLQEQTTAESSQQAAVLRTSASSSKLTMLDCVPAELIDSPFKTLLKDLSLDLQWSNLNASMMKEFGIFPAVPNGIFRRIAQRPLELEWKAILSERSHTDEVAGAPPVLFHSRLKLERLMAGEQSDALSTTGTSCQDLLTNDQINALVDADDGVESEQQPRKEAAGGEEQKKGSSLLSSLMSDLDGLKDFIASDVVSARSSSATGNSAEVRFHSHGLGKFACNNPVTNEFREAVPLSNMESETKDVTLCIQAKLPDRGELPSVLREIFVFRSLDDTADHKLQHAVHKQLMQVDWAAERNLPTQGACPLCFCPSHLDSSQCALTNYFFERKRTEKHGHSLAESLQQQKSLTADITSKKMQRHRIQSHEQSIERGIVAKQQRLGRGGRTMALEGPAHVLESSTPSSPEESAPSSAKTKQQKKTETLLVKRGTTSELWGFLLDDNLGLRGFAPDSPSLAAALAHPALSLVAKKSSTMDGSASSAQEAGAVPYQLSAVNGIPVATKSQVGIVIQGATSIELGFTRLQ
jgi:hypothetical protein